MIGGAGVRVLPAMIGGAGTAIHAAAQDEPALLTWAAFGVIGLCVPGEALPLGETAGDRVGLGIGVRGAGGSEAYTCGTAIRPMFCCLCSASLM
jgi:hypothetical protein